MTRRRKVASTAAVVAILVAVIAASTAAFIRHDRLESVEAARSEVTQVASDQAVAMLSYQHDTVDDQLAAAADGLTGDFKEQYRTLVSEAVAPSAKEKSIDTAVNVVGASVVSVEGDDATVLLFLNQVTTSDQTPEPTTTGSRVNVELTETDGRWAVSGLTPV
ncbi:MAG: hypothetical protein ACOH2Q_02150 [Rhodococcus sp. (in: high G+C Gram-positive bacteria)]